MKELYPYILAIALLPAWGHAQYVRPTPPFAPPAGQPESTAVVYTDETIEAWAASYEAYLPGDDVDLSWQQPAEALGPAGTSVYDVVVLGRGGEITLSFTTPIVDGSGADLAVYENSFNDTFLELAYVEVSSDGEHFVRFPNYSLTADPVSAFGAVDPTLINGLAGKYHVGYGTPFDLSVLQDAYDTALTKEVWTGPETAEFSQAYRNALVENFPYLDLHNITHIRLIDIPGDGSAFDCEGFVVYDPYRTVISAGFDLDAVAALNIQQPTGTAQTISFAEIANQPLSRGRLTLAATADSSLPVTYTVVEGPATIDENVLSFTGKGQVVVQASQAGDETFAPATPVTRSFYIAEELQHLYIAPVRNAVADGGTVQLSVSSSSGLPVGIEVTSGPDAVVVNPETHVLSVGNAPGDVMLRLYQAGDATYAPAPDLLIPLRLTEAGSVEAPQSFHDFAQATSGISGDPNTDTDADGVSDLIEFATGSDPLDHDDTVSLEHRLDQHNGRPTLILTINAATRAAASMQLERADGSGQWQRLCPEILSYQHAGDRIQMEVAVPIKGQPMLVRQVVSP
ncbi:MAG: hypothetical protein E1N59_1131 [Puniceicoccaceae bacterium 5H]|nr:MAG: hypothetical protein E1N59_1131 [Puniceicoccaceae bacterium 5H]